MRGRPAVCAVVLAALALLSLPVGAGAAPFGLGSLSLTAEREGGGPEPQAGAHPYSFDVDAGLTGPGLRSLDLHLPPGLLFTPGGVPECSDTAFAIPRSNPFEPGSRSGESCPDRTQVGTITVHAVAGTRTFGLFNLVPPYGAAGAIGAAPFGVPLVFDMHMREGDAGLDLDLEEAPLTLEPSSLELTIWGRQPWAWSHDSQRGNCLDEEDPSAGYGVPVTPSPYSPGTCTVGSPLYLEEYGHSFLALPAAPCGAPLTVTAAASSWQGEAAVAEAGLPPLSGCHEARSLPHLKLGTTSASSPTRLEFDLEINDGGGNLNPEGEVLPAIEHAVLTLPEGLTLNPSLAAGLDTCTEAQFAAETVGTGAGEGCPGTSKIGAVELAEPLGLPETMKGSVYLAAPHANPAGALVAVYLVVREPRRGLALRSTGVISPDSRGRLTASFEDLPSLLYEHFTVTLREGERAALVSPASCGLYSAGLALSSWAAPGSVREEIADITIDHGPGGGSCPTGAPPFAPSLLAGSINPAAASYTPFYLRITRTDPEQEIASYSATLPPGLLADLSGVGVCPDARVAAAAAHSGAEEQAHPSCPASSSIGHTIAGYGVGGTLAWAPGGLYLAGPYHGAPLSVVAIDAATIGPFDLGTVVVRQAVKVDPLSAQVSLDAAGSDPIPHILAGYPLYLRDIRVYVDRPHFMVNPTSCDTMAIASTIGGSGADPFTSADDITATASQRYQLLDCGALGFRPRLKLRLRGGTRRGRFPALRAELRPRAGDANIGSAKVALPASEFLEQRHIEAVCTRGQFAKETCPAGSVYGSARAITPLLPEPLQGPVYLRSATEAKLPEIVADLHGGGFGLRTEVVGRIDSVHGGLRATFQTAPDAPVSRFVLNLRGGRRGLLVNSENLCAGKQFGNAVFVGHDNAAVRLRPRLEVNCKKGKKKHRKKQKAAHR